MVVDIVEVPHSDKSIMCFSGWGGDELLQFPKVLSEIIFMPTAPEPKELMAMPNASLENNKNKEDFKMTNSLESKSKFLYLWLVSCIS